MQNLSQPLPKIGPPAFLLSGADRPSRLFGSALVQFALVWYLTKETGSATILATARWWLCCRKLCWDPSSAHWWTAGTGVSS